MRTVAAGAAAGALTGALVLVLGNAVAWIAIALSVLAIVAGAVDYVRTRG